MTSPWIASAAIVQFQMQRLKDTSRGRRGFLSKSRLFSLESKSHNKRDMQVSIQLTRDIHQHDLHPNYPGLPPAIVFPVTCLYIV